MMPTLVLPPRLFAPVGYYALMASAKNVVIDSGLRYDKRLKSAHRYEIADTRGRLQLTVPIVKPHGCDNPPTWADAGISSHGEWWRLHLTALESAYGRTPYFEFLIDKFAGIFVDPASDGAAPNVIELARRADRVVRQILDLQTNVSWQPEHPADSKVVDSKADFATPDMPRHYQIRSAQLGFIPSLSILDLIFNLGPEATLYLESFAFANSGHHNTPEKTA